MEPNGIDAKGRGKKERTPRRSFDWLIMRKVICDRYFYGRDAEHCRDCEDRVVCFEMIEDVLNLVDGLKSAKTK